ncbi:hypothetical protein ACVRZD_04260 [Streptococcus hongkongensis]|nr:membrane protein [Streptococcus uberis]
MISYEKVRQSLKTLNIFIIVLNTILAILSVIGLVLMILFLGNDEFKSSIPTEKLAVIEQAMSPFAIFISVLSILLTIGIIVFCILNHKKIKNRLEISLLPYLLGFGLVTVNLISILTAQPSIVAIVIQIIFLTLYYFAFSKAKTLNNKETDDNSEEIDA